MQNKILRKELLWILFSWIVSVSIYFGIVGFNNYGLNDRTHAVFLETGFNTPNWYILLSLLSFVFFIIYIIRVLKEKFTNKNSNIILILSNSLSILFITTDVIKINWINEISKVPEDLQLLWQFVFLLALITQLILILTLVLTAVKTGQNKN